MSRDFEPHIVPYEKLDASMRSAVIEGVAIWIAQRATQDGQSSYEKMDAECDDFIAELRQQMKKFVIAPHTRITFNI